MHWQRATVIDNHHWDDDFCSLKVDADIGEFEAGQFVSLALLGETDKPLARPYSLVNAPGQSPLEFYFNRVQHGTLSPRLHQLKGGDEILIARRAAGFLVLSQLPPAAHLWLLSTGTGIGPFLSILNDSTVWQRFETVTLVQGLRQARQLHYRAQLDQLAHRNNNFRYTCALSREAPQDGNLAGRIPALIRSGELADWRQLPLDNRHTQVMICGNPGLIKDATEALEELGLERNLRRQPGQITTEIYR